MSHTERHIDKTDEELVMRLLVEWKECVGVLYRDYVDEILSYAKTQELAEGENILIVPMNEVVGHSYNRWFEKLLSKAIRAVVLKDGDNLAVHTAYPDTESGVHTNEYFDFSVFGFTGDIFDAFSAYYQNHEYMVRYIPRKKPQLRVYIGTYSFVYNGKTLMVFKGDVEIKTEFCEYYVNHIDALPEFYQKLTSSASNAMFLKLMLALDHKKTVA